MTRIAKLLAGAVAGMLVASTLVFGADKTTLRLDWKAYGTHAPFALGIAKGMYRDEGIDLELLEGTGSGTGVKLIANGSDAFGLVDYAIVASGVDKGMPVKGIFGIMQKGTLAVIATKESGIKSPKDLAGKRLASSMSGSGATMLPVFLAANGVNVESVSQVRVEGAAKAQAVIAKRVDAQVGFGILEAPQIAALGAEPVVLNFADWGVPMMGLGLVTNDTLIAQQPDLARRFVRASAKAWQYALEHQEEAIQALARRFPGVKPEVAIQQLKLTLPLLSTAATKGKPLGWMAESDWEAMQQLLVRSKQIEKARPASSYFTNDFLPR